MYVCDTYLNYINHKLNIVHHHILKYTEIRCVFPLHECSTFCTTLRRYMHVKRKPPSCHCRSHGFYTRDCKVAFHAATHHPSTTIRTEQIDINKLNCWGLPLSLPISRSSWGALPLRILAVPSSLWTGTGRRGASGRCGLWQRQRPSGKTGAPRWKQRLVMMAGHTSVTLQLLDVNIII